MKHAIFTFLQSSICLTTDAQSSFMETMNGFFARQDYDGGLSFLKRQNTLEQGAKDIYYVPLSLSKQDLDEEAKDSCIHSIERIVAEVSIHSDEIPPAGRKEWITYFTAFSNFLSHTAAWPLAMKVHKAFRDICPKINAENKLFYTYELEYTMLSLCGAYNYQDLIPILDEIIALQDSGYHFSKPPYYYYHLLGLCYENTGEDNKAMECLAMASANYPQGEKDSNEYISLQQNRFDAAVRISNLTSAREAGYELIRIFRSNGDDLRLTGTCISLAKLEYTLAANIDAAFNLYEEGIGLILKNSYYTKEDRDNYLKDLFKLYNTYNIPKENRKFARFATDLDDGKKYNVNRYVDEAFIDSLTNVIKSEEGKKNLDVKRYTYAVSAVATYMANRAHEKEGLDLALRAIERCKEQDRNNDFISLYNTIGDIYKINLNDYGKAQEYYTESLKQLQAKELQEGELYISTLNNMAANFMSQGNLVNAKIYIDKTLKLTRNSTVAIAQKANYHDALKNACTIYTSIRQEGKALQFCDELLEDISMSHNDKELDNAKLAKISCLLNFDRYDEAHELLKQISQEYLDKVGILPFSVKFFANDASCVDELAKMHDDLCADAKRLFSDFSMPDLAEYWDTYAGSMNDHCSAALYKFRTNEASLQTFNNLQTTRNFMFQLAKNIRKTGGTDPSAYHNNSPQAMDNTFSSIGDFNQIKKKLNDNEAAIEFLLVKDWKDFRHTENRYGALIVRNNDEAPVFVDLCPQYAIDDIAT